MSGPMRERSHGEKFFCQSGTALVCSLINCLQRTVSIQARENQQTLSLGCQRVTRRLAWPNDRFGPSGSGLNAR